MLVSQINSIKAAIYAMSFPSKVRIRELGPREGFQTLAATIPTAQKFELISALNKTGVLDIEVASFVRPQLVPQMADAEQVVQGYERRAGVRYTALYLNRAGFERAQACARLDMQAWLNTAASATFLQKNNNTTLASVLAGIADWIKLFRSHGVALQGLMLSTAFGCNYEGQIAVSKVLGVLKQCIEAVAGEGETLREVCLADTVGRGNPRQVKELIAAVRQDWPALSISLHFHDTRGTGMANVLAGLQEGIDVFDASVAGMGGCPFAKGAAGNVPSEDVAFMCEEMGISTGLDLEAYVQAALLAERIVGRPLPGKLYKALSGKSPA